MSRLGKYFGFLAGRLRLGKRRQAGFINWYDQYIRSPLTKLLKMLVPSTAAKVSIRL
jgi:hypothetical protein